MTGNKEHVLLRDLVRRLVSEAHVSWPSKLGSTKLRGEAEYRMDIADFPPPEVHRRFQVRSARIQLADGINTYAGTHQKERHVFSVRMAYHVGGGNALEGDLRQMEDLALQDAGAIRQKLEHPDNRADGLDLLTWQGTDIEALSDRLIVTSAFIADIRIRTEAA